jgi:peptide chain release factor 1
VEARLAAALARAEEVERELADPAVARDPQKLKALGREHVRLERIRQTARRLEKLTTQLRDARELARDPDPALAELARGDLEQLAPEAEAAGRELDELLIPPDPLDDRGVIVEVRAGTGGD